MGCSVGLGSPARSWAARWPTGLSQVTKVYLGLMVIDGHKTFKSVENSRTF